LAAEWHPTKNGTLLPEHLAANSSKKVWWKCKQGHEWQASLHNRSKRKGCPYCSGREAIIGENDLKSLYPRLEKEWDYSKNYPLLPNQVKCGSNKKVWWKCSVCGNEWIATINGRTIGHGCPKCGELKKGPKRKTHEQFSNELKLINPQIKLLSKYEVSTQKVMCQCNICGHEWSAFPGNLLKGKGCPICARKR
jgi:Zn finger protein HypA/HybF involved in hydrogenase expression